LLIVLKPLS